MLAARLCVVLSLRRKRGAGRATTKLPQGEWYVQFHAWWLDDRVEVVMGAEDEASWTKTVWQLSRVERGQESSGEVLWVIYRARRQAHGTDRHARLGLFTRPRWANDFGRHQLLQVLP